MTHEDNTQTGKVFPHPKADLAKDHSAPKGPSVGGTIFLSCALGFVLCMSLGALISPTLAPAFGIGGAMLAGAVRVLFLMRGPR